MFTTLHHFNKNRSRTQEHLLDLCNFHLNIGGTKHNAEELVSIIKSVEHGDNCSDFVFRIFIIAKCAKIILRSIAIYYK